MRVARFLLRPFAFLWHGLTRPNAPLLVSSLLLLAGGYLAFLTQDNVLRRDHIAELTAAYYSSGAAEYYAAKTLNEADDKKPNTPYYIAVWEAEDRHYAEFNQASTRLAAEVPPTLRQEILSLEKLWDDIRELDYSSSTVEDRWFDRLDTVRIEVFDQISYKPFFDPGWKK